MRVMTEHDPKPFLRAIKKARERVHHFHQWRNEPAEAKKLRRWKRALKKALAAAQAAEVEIPEDPFAPPPPPPPPPTAAELHQAAQKALHARWIMPWCVGQKTHAWAPWGVSGWSAVDIKGTSRTWCRANRVDPRTGETVSTSAKVRRDRLIKRDPELRGKDKPTMNPDDALPTLAPEVSADPTPAAPVEPVVKLTPEEQAARAAALAPLLDLIDDDATDEDW